jgi:hypothetical protein
MTATLTLDETGRLLLPPDACRVLNVPIGAEVHAEVTERGIELLRDAATQIPEVTELQRTSDGLLVVPPGSFADMDVVAAIKADREARDRKLARR